MLAFLGCFLLPNQYHPEQHLYGVIERRLKCSTLKGRVLIGKKKLAKIHAQTTGKLKQAKIIDKIDEFLKYQRHSKLVETVVIEKYLRLKVNSEVIPRQRC